MPPIEVVGQGDASYGEYTIKATIVRLQNSFLLLVSDQPEYGIGTVTLSAPPTMSGLDAASSPFNIFGMKNNLLANLLGKMASKHLISPVLSLIFILDEKLKPEIIMKTAVEAVKKAIDDKSTQNR
jgi:hypothetical protein